MTDPQRDSDANQYLTELLRKKCGEQRLRITRIRWDLPGNIQVDVQLDLNETSFRILGPILVPLDPSLGLGPSMNCLDRNVLEAVNAAFPCEQLRQRASGGETGNVR